MFNYRFVLFQASFTVVKFDHPIIDQRTVLWGGNLSGALVCRASFQVKSSWGGLLSSLQRKIRWKPMLTTFKQRTSSKVFIDFVWPLKMKKETISKFQSCWHFRERPSLRQQRSSALSRGSCLQCSDADTKPKCFPDHHYKNERPRMANYNIAWKHPLNLRFFSTDWMFLVTLVLIGASLLPERCFVSGKRMHSHFHILYRYYYNWLCVLLVHKNLFQISNLDISMK